MNREKVVFNDIPLTRLAGTLAKCIGVDSPSKAAPPLEDMSKYIGGNIEKMLIYNPNSIGASLITKYAEDFQKIKAVASHEVSFLTEYPPLTNVCLSTMYTGVHPSVHKINKNSNTDTNVESLFDMLSQSGKKSAIIADDKSAITKIFSKSNADIYKESYDGGVINKAIELIKESQYDLLVIFNQEYDDIMHITHPESKQALCAMRTHISTFELLANAAEVYWQSYNTLIGFAPDHGAHRAWYGLGAHCKFSPEDLNITHYYGVQPRIK